MALYHLSQRGHIDATTVEWADRCLVNDGSLLDGAQEQLWEPDSLARIHTNIVDAPLHDSRNFIDKLKEQFEGDPKLVQLGGEALVVYYLFVSRGAVGGATKRARVNEVLGWSGRSLDQGSESWLALGEEGIGHPGQGFLYRPDIQLGFLLNFALRLKGHPNDERRAILDDPWRLLDLADESAEGGSLPGMRHIVLHLLQPRYFERIASGEHKQSILTAFSDLAGEEESDEPDKRLYLIREKLQGLLGMTADQMDFYEPPLWGTWGTGRADGSDLIDKLELKRQIVLYGPPGTSKTHEAGELAAQIIRRHALKAWGAATYFERDASGQVKAIIDSHIERLQLHPGYSYEEFIRGLRLRGGELIYEDGYLLRLIDRISNEPVPPGEQRLPWVLILDELNRADLSRVLGEAFSVLENRTRGVKLAGGSPDQPDREIKLPESLYIIGTMNLIDQSLEQVDFALRRRFLWQPSRFDASRLTDVIRDRWGEQPQSASYPWEKISGQVDLLVERATKLNDEIANSATLNRDYQIGHTYFFDLVPLLAHAEHMNRPRTQRYLWTKKGEALPPVESLWQMSLEPLLDQYLQGVDPQAREAALKRFEGSFLRGEA